VACDRDFDGVVAKLTRETYQADGRGTSWVKVKNSRYSKLEGRGELFEARRQPMARLAGQKGIISGTTPRIGRG
jgi:hypothetical protein